MQRGRWTAAAGAAVQVVRRLAVGGQVDAVDLVLLVEAEADRVLDRQGDDGGEDARVDDRDEDSEGLVAERAEAAAVEQPVDAAGTLRCGEHADQHSADDATDEVHADHVERVVVAELVLQPDGPGADPPAMAPMATAPLSRRLRPPG